MDDFMTGISRDGRKLESDEDFTGHFNDAQETDTPDDSSSENDQVDPDSAAQEAETDSQATSEPESPVDEKKGQHEDVVPYQRFKSVIEEKNFYKQQAEELMKHRSEAERKVEEQYKMPKPWERVFGDDDESADDVRNYENYLIERAKNAILAEQQRAAQETQRRVTQWESYSESSMDRLAEQGKSFDRKELKALAEQYPVIDQQGNVDYDKVYSIYEQQKSLTKTANTDKNKARKSIADTDSSSAPVSSKTKDGYSMQDIRGKSIFDFALEE